MQDAGVGLVTCLSHDAPTAGLWSRLGAMYVNEWYFPSVMLAWLFGYQDYASGQTLCLRRTTLEAIGGFGAFADHLADDYQLGQLIRARGLRIVLSPYEVQAGHDEPDLASLTRHEVRWMRTLHIVRPWSFRMIFLTFSLVLALIGIALTTAGTVARGSLDPVWRDGYGALRPAYRASPAHCPAAARGHPSGADPGCSLFWHLGPDLVLPTRDLARLPVRRRHRQA